MSYEIRRYSELRANDDGKLVGYAAVFNAPSHDLGGFVEIILPGAFDRTLKENPDVLALIEHDISKVIGRTANGSLVLVADERGLRVELTPAATTAGRDILELVRGAFVSGMSFRFKPYPGGVRLDTRKTPAIRTLSSVQLKEVSIVVDPAYPDADVAVRALEEARKGNVRDAVRRMRMRIAQTI